ncbi:MAG: PEGA domain-containing protein [Methanomicrobiales archaeon]|nr:PEGA domain-containing protein [Methanomicrobiales archaeon]
MVSEHTQGASWRLIILSLCLLLALAAPVVAAPTTELHIKKIAADGITILGEKTVDYRWLEANLPVQGDGQTHYYHQGPVFEGDPWNPEEDTNVLDKDMGAVKGTDLKDICELVGGMSEEDTVRIRAVDGMSKTFPYRNVYEPESRQGPMVITWYRAEDGYVPDYYTGMRLVFFADTSTNPDGVHAFGVWDMHECFDEEYWYFFQPNLPTTTGLSVQYVSEITIYSEEEATGSIYVNSTPSGATIYVDDEKAGGVTPCTIPGIEVGSHSVLVKLEGFARPDEKWVTVRVNEVTEVEFNLTAETGSIAVSSVPTNASIYLDGNVTGFFTDAILEDILVGEHTIKLVLPGYLNATHTIEVEKDECSILDIVLFSEESALSEPIPGTGTIAVSSVPANASIYLDGEATGLWTNTTLKAVPAGEHTIKLVLPGYRNATEIVTVEEGGHIALDLTLSRAGDETEADTTVRDEPTPERQEPDGPVEAFIETIRAFLKNLFSFFGGGTATPMKPESTQTPGKGTATPAPTGAAAPPTKRPSETEIVKSHSGGLYIESYPPDMAIILDNKKQIWKTPHVIYGLREGLHTIDLEESDPAGKKEDSSYRFEPRQVWVYPDAIAPVSLDGLTPRRWKTVQIDSEAYVGAKFTVNGFYPASNIPGTAEIEGAKSWVTVLWEETYRSHAIPLRVGDDETYTVEPGSENTVSITIRSDPGGAGVFIDGFPTGKVTPCRIDGISPGQHRILVSKPGYLPAEEVISIQEGARTGGAITCALREYVSGDLLVESTVPDAKIYLYGRYTGEKAPHTFPAMCIGIYDVRAVSENDSKTVWDVLVTPGETTICRVVLKE